ncbi:MAG: ketose-bisphosphate aldolase [Clostridia bacterium]|nr:ketose-bisphosphate aldolase [Clostridia bacterium]
MALVTVKKLVDSAERQGKAVGAFSVGNMEMVMGAVAAAEDSGEPIILQIAEKRLKNSPLELMAPMMVSAAQHARVDIAVHLDHGLTLDCIQAALDYGFTSVMLDASLLPFEENIAMTGQVVAKAARYGASVEAELGVVGGNEGDTAEHKILCTDPQAARTFCEQTGVDALAVAIGNAHGNYPVLPALRFDILEQIDKTVDTPLVLHGGTGITDEMFRKAVALGIRKINIATASFDHLARYAKAYTDTVDAPDYFKLSSEMARGVYDNVLRHIKVFSNR